jgi:hypothetical protein
MAAVMQVLATCGWKINTAMVEVRPVGRKELGFPYDDFSL